jgi:hypothetical protein
VTANDMVVVESEPRYRTHKPEAERGGW